MMLLAVIFTAQISCSPPVATKETYPSQSTQSYVGDTLQSLSDSTRVIPTNTYNYFTRNSSTYIPCNIEIEIQDSVLLFNGKKISRIGNTLYDTELRYNEPDVTTHQMSYTDNSITIGNITYYKTIPAKTYKKTECKTFCCDKDYTLYSLSKKLHTSVGNIKTKNNNLDYAQKGNCIKY